MNARAKSMFEAWHARQGAKIKGARPAAVYAHCVLMAKDLAKTMHAQATGELILTVEQIGLCEQRALSQVRIARFGAPPATADEWHTQLARIREEWASERPAA
jgi:hypothetical protein